jgi:hypothetical protein
MDQPFLTRLLMQQGWRWTKLRWMTVECSYAGDEPKELRAAQRRNLRGLES